MRHSATPRSMSSTRKVKRPVWSAARRLHRPTSRRRSSVIVARRAMGCILCTRAPYVYPATRNRFAVPPLRTAKRGSGGGTYPLRAAQRCSGGGVYPPTPRLVRALGARPPVAQNARPVPGARLGGHAAADAGEPGERVLSPVSRALPHRAAPGARRASRGARSLGRARVLRSSFESPRACARSESGFRRQGARESSSTRQTPGSGALYGGGGGELRV